jgi:hypothetical protein
MTLIDMASGEDVSDVPQVDYDPSQPTGLLTLQSEAGTLEPLGTCFAFRHRCCLLTAAHCLPSSPRGVGVAYGGANAPRPVIGIERHPTADLALVRLAPRAEDSPLVFTGLDSHSVGEEICALGFPVNDPGEQDLTTPRFFRGYTHRTMRFTSPLTRQTYLAGELSFSPPRGLSGAALYRHHRFPLVQGLVTEHHESYTETTPHEEQRSVIDNVETRIVYRRVVGFGIALLLADVAAWLDEVAYP